MPIANFTITVQAQNNHLYQDIVILVARIFGLGHPLVAKTWNRLKPIQLKFGDGSWKVIYWHDVLRAIGG